MCSKKPNDPQDKPAGFGVGAYDFGGDQREVPKIKGFVVRLSHYEHESGFSTSTLFATDLNSAC